MVQVYLLETYLDVLQVPLVDYAVDGARNYPPKVGVLLVGAVSAHCVGFAATCLAVRKNANVVTVDE